jgi:SAM-dependent methyltransferase
VDAPVITDGLWNPSLGGVPSESISRLAALTPVRSVLDLGCGDARNLLPFTGIAELLVGIDPHLPSLGVARARLSTSDARVGLLGARLPHVAFARQFDLVICHGVLHFLSPTDRAQSYTCIQQLTSPGGLVSIVAFNARQPIPPDLLPLMAGAASDSDELLGAFSRWTLLDWRSYDYDDEHDEGAIRHTHAIDRLVARKPLS